MPTISIGGGEYHNILKGTMQAGGHIYRLVSKETSVASCDTKLVPVGKRQEKVLPVVKLEQRRYKFLLIINRYDKGAYSLIVVDNIIMTICRNKHLNKFYFDVLGFTSRRGFSMLAIYKECLEEYEFADYIKILEHKVKVIGRYRAGLPPCAYRLS